VLGEDRDDIAMATSETLDDLLQSTPDVRLGQRHDSFDDARRA